jgi:hypothetical protein
MLKSIFTIAWLIATATGLPLIDDGSAVSLQTRNPVTPEEVSTACVLPAGNTAGCPTQAQNFTGDVDDGKTLGLVVYNKDNVDRSFFVYKVNCDCVPVKYLTIPANDHKFIAFTAGFQGRITRGTEEANLDGMTHKLATWMEFSWDPNGTGWADVSLIKGCDGAVDVTAIDGIGAKTGFNMDVLTGAPAGAYKAKAVTGTQVIMETENVVDYKDVYQTPRNWLAGKLGYTKAYIDDYHGNPDICSVNGRFAINFYPGRF